MHIISTNYIIVLRCKRKRFGPVAFSSLHSSRVGGQGGTHKVRGWGKLMLPVGVTWYGKGDCMETRWVIAGIGVEEWARRCIPQRMPLMID